MTLRTVPSHTITLAKTTAPERFETINTGVAYAQGKFRAPTTNAKVFEKKRRIVDLAEYRKHLDQWKSMDQPARLEKLHARVWLSAWSSSNKLTLTRH